MAQYDLPNNQKLNVPDNLDPALREKLAGAIQRQFGVDINETTVLGQAAETLKGIPRGAIGLVADVPLGAASLFDIGNDSDFVQGLRQFKDYLNTESAFAADPAYRDKWLTKLGEGAGSFVPFLGAAKVGQLMSARGIGQQAMLRSPKTWMKDPMYAVPGALALPSGISQQADRVSASRELGEDVGGIAETFAELGGGIVGLSEIAPVLNLFKRVPKNALQYSDIRRKINSALRSGAQEGLQEVSASLVQDLIARGLYSDELPIGESIFDEFTIGGAVGALADLGVNAMSGRSRGRQGLYDREKQARENIVSLQEEHKFKRAQQQESLEEVVDVPITELPSIKTPAGVIPGPQLAVIQNADQQFSVIDLQNLENPVLQSFDTEVKASAFRNEQETNYERKKLSAEIENTAYILGLPKSGTAKTIGSTINDVNSSSINLQSIINFDSKLANDQKKLFAKEKFEAGFRSLEKGEPIVYSEMVKNKKERLTEVRKYIESKRKKGKQFNNLSLKASYTMPEAKHILNRKDYNALLGDLTATVFQASEEAEIPALTKKEPTSEGAPAQYDVSNKYIKDLAASKNINLDFNSPAVRYAIKQWTGYEGAWKSAKRPVKELFLARLHSLPKFNFQTSFPDFRPRSYTAQDVANFVATRGSQNIDFSVEDLKNDGVTAKDKDATQQFINDLVVSGRAEKIKGTNKYRIRPNHQFDIARRAEGFNETPEEFGEKLRQENELPENIIESLVEKERQRQSKVLPPQEIDKKVINFKQAVEEGRTNVLARNLKKVLDKRGLPETGLVISNDILSTTNLVQTKDGEIKFDPRETRATEAAGAVEGQYDRETDIIFLSLNAVNPDGMASQEQILDRLAQVLDHEMIHAFRNKDLMTEPDYQFLRKQVKKRKVPATYDAAFKNKTFYDRAKAITEQDTLGFSDQRKEELYVEEGIAEMFRARSHKPEMPPKSKGIFNKIAGFFESMGSAMRASGFKRVSDIFNDIESGAVGARTRGEIRTLRELDRLPPQLIDAPIAQDFEEGEVAVEDEVTDVVEIGESGAIATPVSSFEDIESDTDPITGVILTPSGVGTGTKGQVYDRRKQTNEQLLAERAAIIKEFGRDHVDSENVLDWLVKNAPSADYRVISERLLSQIKNLKKVKGIDFQFRIIQKGTDRLDVRGHKGADTSWLGVSYYPFTYQGKRRQQIYIRDFKSRPTGEIADGVTFETILHELVHQATQAVTYDYNIDDKTQESIKNLETLRARIKKEINERGRAGEDIDQYVRYGTKNLQELLAVGFTDREFQRFMEAIPYSPRGKKTLWDKFAEGIRKLLNIPAKQDTAFSEFLLQAGKITSLSQKQIRQTSEGRDQEVIADYIPDVNKPGSIQDQIDALEVRLMPLESEMRQEGTLMSRRNQGILANKINNIKREIETLEAEKKRQENININRPPRQLAMFSRGKRFASDSNTSANKQLQEATEKAVEIVKQTPRGEVPYYNVNASDVALEAAINFNEDVTAKAPPKDIPNYSRGALPSDLADDIKRTGYNPSDNLSLGARLLNVINDPKESVGSLFNHFRENYVDKLDQTVKKVLAGKNTEWYMGVDREGKRRKNPETGQPWTLPEAQVAAENVRLANNSADTATIAAMRLADKARGIFNQMLMTGYPSDQVAGIASLTNVKKFKIATRYNPFIDGNEGTGGLMQILSVLYADPTVDLESVFGYYAKTMRIKVMEDNGKVINSPITEKDKAQLQLIRRKYPSVVEAYNNYQKWNNELIGFAKEKGLLNAEQANMWREHSSYYPFYRDMVDDSGLAAPTIGGGSLPSNPLNIKMEGSEREISVNPVEAIARNSLSILTGAMKNDGTSKLLRDLQVMGEARYLDSPEKVKAAKNKIFVFEDGNKKYYEVDDFELFHGIQAIGGVKTDAVTKILAAPSSLLRDTVTRDPGFVVVNLLRDTLSAAVTSGAPLGGEGFTPVIDTVKNMMADMSDLEKFGVVGGYDFQNDEGSIVQLMERARRQQGLSPDNGISAKDGFFKLWDGLGALTTKSDGATRLAVYNAVYKDMKNRGYNEAQAQSEAAYQALEIINFGRRGLSPLFRIVTAALPFFNARIQGLDVLYRSAAGKYSAIEKLEAGETMDDVQSRIIRKFWLRASGMMTLTLMYYLMVSDTDEYKAVKRELRDDNWIIPLPLGLTPMKIPIPFEVGMLFKAIPERFIDMAMGQVEKDPLTSITRQLKTSGAIPFLEPSLGIQAVKPLVEAIANRNTFTNTNIVPYYMEKGEPAYQSRQSTNEIARLVGEAMNISPMKIEHVLSGYTGTLGGYALSLMDVAARGLTGTPIMPPNMNDIPVIKRLFFDLDRAGGLQQQFYELRETVTGAVTTLNSLKKQQRWDEVAAFREHNKGVFQVRGQINAINRYMTNWRRRRDRLLRRTDISPMVKSDMLRELELDRDKRLAIMPALRERADVPAISLLN
jgi:hypothetical protein